MNTNPYLHQLDEQVLCAEPLELVHLLSRALHEAIQESRMRLRQQDIAARSRAVSRGLEVLGELSRSLDLSRGGEMAAGLARLYVFIAERLQEGNFRQTDGPLAEAEAVAATLLDAWTGLRAGQTSPGALPAYAGYAEPEEAISFSLCA